MTQEQHDWSECFDRARGVEWATFAVPILSGNLTWDNEPTEEDIDRLLVLMFISAQPDWQLTILNLGELTRAKLRANGQFEMADSLSVAAYGSLSCPHGHEVYRYVAANGSPIDDFDESAVAQAVAEALGDHGIFINDWQEGVPTFGDDDHSVVAEAFKQRFAQHVEDEAAKFRAEMDDQLDRWGRDD